MNIQDRRIQIRDPLAAQLGGPVEVEVFSLSLLDVARLSGHLCPSVAGAFLAVEAAVKALFKDQVCERGLLEVELPGSLTDAANGPISNVIGYLTGAWADSGFGGLGGQHKRRGLLRFQAPNLNPGQFRFLRNDTGETIEITYRPQQALVSTISPSNFQSMWQQKVRNILSSPDVIELKFLR